MARRPLPEFRDRFLDPEETSVLLGVSLQSIRQDTTDGKLGLPRFQFGSRVRFLLSELLRWAEAHRVTPAPPEHLAVNANFSAMHLDDPARRGRRRRREPAAPE
jgi:Helix-turn-helix domain